MEDKLFQFRKLKYNFLSGKGDEDVGRTHKTKRDDRMLSNKVAYTKRFEKTQVSSLREISGPQSNAKCISKTFFFPHRKS